MMSVMALKAMMSRTNKINFIRPISSLASKDAYKVVIVGGGAGGITMASRLSKRIPRNEILVIDPADVHYYQPYWTLVGGALVDFKKSGRPMARIIPTGIKWLQDSIVSFHPASNIVKTKFGKEIKYEFLVVALGIKLGFEKIKGLPEAFGSPGVCSNYSAKTVVMTADALKSFKKGNAIFTQPVAPIKCAGAPQKIAYLADDYFRQAGKRSDANVIFCTAMNTIFSVPKYAAALCKVAEKKNITVNYCYNLVEVKPQTKEAIFQVLGSSDSSNVTMKYEMLHITPPMFPPDPIKECKDLSDSSGFLELDKSTLQHPRFPNVFGIGDCTNLPTSKTAAAVAAQSGVLTENIFAVMSNQPRRLKYNGYTSCPLVTGNKKAILAEFDYDLNPLETLPFDQSKERYISYILKKNVLPSLYWSMLRGYWRGPGPMRNLLRLRFTFGLG